MTFTPIVPFGGIAGKLFLDRTRENQQSAFVQSPRLERNTVYFSDTIAKVSTAQALVEDRRLLEVALGAFGLDSDINNRFFIEKILSSDLTDQTSLANRLSDKRYLALATAFGFNTVSGSRTETPDFAQQIVSDYQNRQFEIAIGEQSPNMRLILGLERDLAEITDRTTLSDDAMWFSIMASKPLRTVFETALGLPQSFGALDLDRQLVEFRSRAEKTFGLSEVSQFAEPDRLAELENIFLARSQLQDSGSNSTIRGSVALAILQS